MDYQFFSLAIIIRRVAIDYMYWRSTAECLIDAIANEENA